MKKTVLILTVLLLASAVAWAQMGGGMRGKPDQQTRGWGWGPGYGMDQGMMGGYGMMGYGMGPGYGMGQGMMRPGMMGYGMGPGYGMGQGMMGMMHGGGMGPGMMGMMHGGGMGPGMMNVYNPQMQKFLNETRELRKELHMKQFDYSEAIRNPKTTPEAMEKLQKDIRTLNIKLYEKMPVYQYGQ
jgi:hypothetical protein